MAKRRSVKCSKNVRLAIYLRDSFCCVWCSKVLEAGVVLSLDHVTPHSHGGSNHPSNLVTACRLCNSVRGNASVEEWASKVSKNPAKTVARIKFLVTKPLPLAEANAMIRSRGYDSVLCKD